MTETSSPPMSRFNVKVTEKDIERAHRNDSYICVVAQAIARTVPDATRVEVDTQSIRFTRNGARYIYLTPMAVQGYVIGFDAGDEISPFSFQLRDPHRVARKTRTDAGKKADRAAERVKNGRDHLPADGSNPVPSGVARDRQAKAARKAARKAAAPAVDPRAAYAAAKADADEPAQISDRAGRKAPPRVFKSKQRSYGHRLLRINQQAATDE